ncbi:hypothetical protein KKF84_06215 [Myxococcota bacterium]|nr:hypothetical protein [Myxococcota bacterium]MBU1534894.1 hypothetical protein [Myxococcota bacterium]
MNILSAMGFSRLYHAIKMLTIVVVLCSLTLPLWGEVIHHHSDFRHHAECHQCNIAHAQAVNTDFLIKSINIPSSFIVLTTTIKVVFTTQSPLVWSPSHSPPSCSL